MIEFMASALVTNRLLLLIFLCLWNISNSVARGANHAEAIENYAEKLNMTHGLTDDEDEEALENERELRK